MIISMILFLPTYAAAWFELTPVELHPTGFLKNALPTELQRPDPFKTTLSCLNAIDLLILQDQCVLRYHERPCTDLSLSLKQLWNQSPAGCSSQHRFALHWHHPKIEPHLSWNSRTFEHDRFRLFHGFSQQLLWHWYSCYLVRDKYYFNFNQYVKILSVIKNEALCNNCQVTLKETQ